ncbi:MAG: PHP domain-containing protein [Christensenellales bacterium]
MKNGVNLHCHSLYSDGELTYTQLIERAKLSGIKFLAISDHDTIINYKKHIREANENGVVLINAIEFNVEEYKNFHFIAFGVCDLDYLEKYMDSMKQYNESVCFSTIDKLKSEYGINLSVDYVKSLSQNGLIDKRCIAKALYNLGYVSNTHQAYTDFIGANAKAYVPIKKLNAKDLINLVHKCGGVVCWAHPTTTRNKQDDQLLTLDEIRAKAKELKNLSLDGIEVYTAHSTVYEEQYINEFARDFGLVRVGGSDFHRFGDSFECEKLTVENYKELVNCIKQRHHIYYSKHYPNCSAEKV